MLTNSGVVCNGKGGNKGQRRPAGVNKFKSLQCPVQQWWLGSEMQWTPTLCSLQLWNLCIWTFYWKKAVYFFIRLAPPVSRESRGWAQARALGVQGLGSWAARKVPASGLLGQPDTFPHLEPNDRGPGWPSRGKLPECSPLFLSWAHLRKTSDSSPPIQLWVPMLCSQRFDSCVSFCRVTWRRGLRPNSQGPAASLSCKGREETRHVETTFS